ncbi:hypothetical protein ACFLYY_00755 [Patescibacteria group bacterium]
MNLEKFLNLLNKIDNTVTTAYKNFQDFYIKIVAGWFKILGWILILTAIFIVSIKFKFPVATTVFQISLFLFVFYVIFKVRVWYCQNPFCKKHIKSHGLKVFIDFVFFPTVGTFLFYNLLQFILELAYKEIL